MNSDIEPRAFGYSTSVATTREEYEDAFGDENYDSDASSNEEPIKPAKEKSKRPIENAFTQQKLRAVNPVFTPKIVILLFFAIAVIFVPLGAAMWLASDRIQDFSIDYSECQNLASEDYWQKIPTKYVTFNFKNRTEIPEPTWRLGKDETQQFDDEKLVCHLQFNVPKDMGPPVYFFYRLENFHANHRRFAQSFSELQIEGKAATTKQMDAVSGQDCSPLKVNDEGKIYYPCGLIANSMFNDTYSTELAAVNGTSKDYPFTDWGTSWETDKHRFKKTKYRVDQIVPPPNWYKRYPNGYNESNVPDISSWWQFQNWMHTPALPTFNKLALRNDNDTLTKGTYEVSVGLHFPVLPYKGHKYIYVSERSVMGGKNSFMGISWMVGGGVSFVLGLSLLILSLIKPRRVGDINLLSWRREQFEKDEQDDSVKHTGEKSDIINEERQSPL